MLSKHGPSRMFRFFHGKFSTVNGLPMDFRHINVCNTNVCRHHSIKVQVFYQRKSHNIHPKHFSCSEYPKQFKVVLQNTRIQTRGPNPGGGGCFHDTTFRTQQPKHIFFFLFIYYSTKFMSLIQMLCKEGPLKRKIWEH